MNPLTKIKKKYGITHEDTKLLVEVLVRNLVNQSEIDGVIYHKYNELSKNISYQYLNKKPKIDLVCETPIQEWALLYLESLENLEPKATE